jgi:uncharacterized membrane protein YpjA
MNSILKVLATVVLLLVGLVGLAMSLCGTIFTVTSLGNLNGPGNFLIFSLPTMLVGGAIVFGTWKAYRAWRPGPPKDDVREAGRDAP